MLKISTSDYQAIRRHGEETYPSECCGILLGSFETETRIVRSVIACENTCTLSPQSRYDIDPRELIRAQREAHASGHEIVGFYHSHPDHPPQWSPTDLEEAHWIGCSYVITTVKDGKAAVSNSFVLAGKLEEDKAFAPEQLVVEPDLPATEA